MSTEVSERPLPDHDCDENQVIKPISSPEGCDKCPGFWAYHAWVCEVCNDPATTGGREHFNAEGRREWPCPGMTEQEKAEIWAGYLGVPGENTSRGKTE